jgi:hypothetical protein
MDTKATAQAGASSNLKERLSINLDDYPDSHLFDRPQAAQILGITEGTLSVWASVGRYNLKFTKIGRRAKYRAGDLREFIAKRTVTHTGQAPA